MNNTGDIYDEKKKIHFDDNICLLADNQRDSAVHIIYRWKGNNFNGE